MIVVSSVKRRANAQAPRMQKKKTDHLFRSHTNSLDAEFAAAEVEEVFQVGAQKVDDENVVETLLTEMVDLRDANCAASREKYMH